jgi:uncharacterized protein
MNTAEYWIEKLNLQKHPEGGYFSETYRNNESIKKEHLPERYNGDKCFSTLIYYLLKENDLSHFHRLKSDEIWHFYSGSPLIVHLIDENGNYKSVLLGSNIETGEMFQFVIPRNTWFGAEVKDKSSFSLIGCTVSPGFDFDDFELGKKRDLSDKYPRYINIINYLTNL